MAKKDGALNLGKITLDSAQAADLKALETEGFVGLLAQDPGNGKQQPVTEPVLTPKGWVPIGTLRPGDYVVGSNGRPTEVLGVFPQVDRTTYKVTFNDGSWTLAGPDHLWSARTHNQANRGKPFGVVSTDQLRETINRRWSIPMTERVDGPDVDLPCDPYLMGAFLGDGFLGPNGKGTMCSDVDVIERAGLRVTRAHRSSSYTAYASVSYNTLGRSVEVPSRSWEKSVPEAFMRGSYAQRLALLQGLLDTDGSPVPTGGVEFTSVSEELVDQVLSLIHI